MLDTRFQHLESSIQHHNKNTFYDKELSQIRLEKSLEE